MKYVLDSSVALKWVLQEVDSGKAIYSGPHCLDQKMAFLSYTPEASVAPRPLL